MAISYNKLWKLLVDKKMSKADLRKAAGIAPNTMTRLRRDEEVTLPCSIESALREMSISEMLWNLPMTKDMKNTMADTKLFNIKGTVKEYQSGTVTLEKPVQCRIDQRS